MSPTSGLDEINFFGEAVNVDLQCPVLAPQLLHLLNLREEVGQEVRQEVRRAREVIALKSRGLAVGDRCSARRLAGDRNMFTASPKSSL